MVRREETAPWKIHQAAGRLRDGWVRRRRRVSMDYITLDVSKIPEDKVRPGSVVELIGPYHSIDALAEEAGTLAYEILTGLGTRHTRVYCSDGT